MIIKKRFVFQFGSGAYTYMYLLHKNLVQFMAGQLIKVDVGTVVIQGEFSNGERIASCLGWGIGSIRF